MIKEGEYTLSELRVAIKESAKNEFKPKLGNKVESDNKKNNGEAVKDITKRVEKYNGEPTKRGAVLPFDRNKTTLDLKFNEMEPGKEWLDRVDAQVHGFPSVENEKSSDTKENGGLDYEGNKRFGDHRKKIAKERQKATKDDKDAGLRGRELKPYNTEPGSLYEGRTWRNERERRNMESNTIIKEEFDFEDDNMITVDMVAKDFIKWATEEADTGHNFPMNAMQYVVDAYKGDDNALDDLVAAYEEARGYDMLQDESVRKGIEKAINAYGYYNLSQNLKESKKANTMKRLTFKSKVFLNENEIKGYIPESYKTDGNKFYVKDASGTQYMVECVRDKQFGFMTVNIVNKLNEDKEKAQIKRMKDLFNYKSSEYFGASDKGGDSVQRLHEGISKIKDIEKNTK